MKRENEIIVKYRDVEHADDALIILRCNGKRLGICISLRKNGDLETFLDLNSASELCKAISQILESEKAEVLDENE